MKNSLIVLLIIIMASCTPLTLKQKESLWGTHPPVIKRVIASPIAKPGYPWKLYLDAEDEDGDMQYLYVFIYQTGIGLYPPCFIKLPQRLSRHLQGYFELSIPDDYWTSGLKMHLEVFLKDKAGHKSNTVYFLIKVVYKKQPPLKVPPALDRFLGTIDIRVGPPLIDDEGGYFGGFGANAIWGN